jgi:hypothetical protein
MKVMDGDARPPLAEETGGTQGPRKAITIIQPATREAMSDVPGLRDGSAMPVSGHGIDRKVAVVY